MEIFKENTQKAKSQEYSIKWFINNVIGYVVLLSVGVFIGFLIFYKG